MFLLCFGSLLKHLGTVPHEYSWTVLNAVRSPAFPQICISSRRTNESPLTWYQTFMPPPSHFLFHSSGISVNVRTSSSLVFSCPLMSKNIVCTGGHRGDGRRASINPAGWLAGTDNTPLKSLTFVVHQWVQDEQREAAIGPAKNSEGEAIDFLYDSQTAEIHFYV